MEGGDVVERQNAIAERCMMTPMTLSSRPFCSNRNVR
jgi:hypothetical protein